MRAFFLSLSVFVALSFLSLSHAVTPVYDALGRLTNGDAVYKANNPPPKGKKNRPVPEIDQYNHLGVTPLQQAVLHRKIDEVRALLGKKANPNIISARGQTALQMAVGGNQPEIARLLLSHKANPNLGDTLGLAKSDEMTKLLKAHGAKAGQKKEKKVVHMSLHSMEESKIISETIREAKNNNKPIPTLAQAVILDQSPARLDEMLKKGHDINEEDPHFGTALHQFFVQRRDKSIGVFLLEKGANPNWTRGSYGTSPFFSAISRSDTEMLSLMLKKGANIAAENREGRQALSLAADNGKPDIIRRLLDAGANADARDAKGYTALYYLLWRQPKAMEAARALLEKGASTTVGKNTEALNAIQWREENLDMMLLLLEYKAKPVSDKDGETLVVFAVRAGSFALLNVAINAGVDVNVRDRRETSALEYAVINKQPEMVQRLLEAGAPINGSVSTPGRQFVDSYGKIHQGTDDLLATAVRQGDVRVIKVLIDGGVDLDTSANSFEKPTPLHMAIQRKRKDIADMLLDAGADPNSRNRYGETPLHIAVEKSDVPMIQRLLAAKADVNLPNERGETPLDTAGEKKNRQIAEILVKSGGKRNTKN